MTRRYLILSATCITLVIGGYITAFAFIYEMPISKSPSDWAALGDYAGGLLNPILSFFSVILIVKSIEVQRESNSHFKSEIDRAKTESHLRTFEAKLFGLIAAQSEQFRTFTLHFESSENEKSELHGVEAALALEDVLAELISSGISPNMELILSHFDRNDSILSCIRRFYVPLKVIMNELSDQKGFCRDLREDYVETLINFTDLSLLRVIILGSETLAHATAKFVDDNSELSTVLERLDFKRWTAKE